MDVQSTNHEEIQASTESIYDRRNELQAFDDTKTGVKGLVDAAITNLPRIFLHPQETLKDITTPTKTPFSFPVIDLEGIDEDPRKRDKIVAQVGEASEKWGFFQVVNHGIPASTLEEMVNAVRGFNEQETEIKKQYYTRDMTRKFGFNSNFDLFSSPAANWRDSLFCAVAPDPPQPDQLPPLCR